MLIIGSSVKPLERALFMKPHRTLEPLQNLEFGLRNPMTSHQTQEAPTSPDKTVLLLMMYCKSCTTFRTLNYGNYGVYLIMGNAGFLSSTVGLY